MEKKSIIISIDGSRWERIRAQIEETEEFADISDFFSRNMLALIEFLDRVAEQEETEEEGVTLDEIIEDLKPMDSMLQFRVPKEMKEDVEAIAELDISPYETTADYLRKAILSKLLSDRDIISKISENSEDREARERAKKTLEEKLKLTK